MHKKIIKFVLCLIGLASVLAGIYYFFQKKKQSQLNCVAEKNEKDEAEDIVDFLDLSNLKFSRHYVDLR